MVPKIGSSEKVASRLVMFTYHACMGHGKGFKRKLDESGNQSMLIKLYIRRSEGTKQACLSIDWRLHKFLVERFLYQYKLMYLV